MLLTEKNFYYEKIYNEFIKLNLYELLEIENNLNIFNLINKENEKIFKKDLKKLNENDLKFLSNEFKYYFNDKIKDILIFNSILEKKDIINYLYKENKINYKIRYIYYFYELQIFNEIENEIIKTINENELNNLLIEIIFKDIKNYELFYNYEIEN